MLFFSFCKIVFGWFPGVGRQGTVQFDLNLVVIEDNLFDEAVDEKSSFQLQCLQVELLHGVFLSHMLCVMGNIYFLIYRITFELVIKNVFV